MIIMHIAYHICVCRESPLMLTSAHIFNEVMPADENPHNNATKRLSSFIRQTQFEDIPTDVLDHASLMMVDSVAVILAANNTEPESIVRKVYSKSYDQGTDIQDSDTTSVRVIGTGDTGSPRDVALLMGLLGHSLDFDDLHQEIGGHPSAPVLSALFPIAERENATGRDFLRSFILGVEVEVALANVLNPGLYDQGWHPTAIFGAMGAAAAVSDLLDLNVNEIRTAFGIAASNTSGIKGNFGTMTKPLHVGEAARSGQQAAELAAGGLTANMDILELEFGGFFDLYHGESGLNSADDLDSLGTRWGILNPPVGFKLYPCCGSTHSAIDAAVALHDELDVSATEIETIRVREHPRRLGHTNNPNPQTSLDAKFSLQYIVSVALQEGEIWLDHFSQGSVNDPNYRSLMCRVEVIPDAESFQEREWGAVITIETSNNEYTASVDAPTGFPNKPMSKDDIIQKYRRSAISTIDEENIDMSITMLSNIRDVSNISDLIDVLTP
jgi:2-methylcitrate dehydratase PrpD